MNEGPFSAALGKRYELLPESHPDTVALRGGVQEGGPGLYVVRLGERFPKRIVEAYRHIARKSPSFYWMNLTPEQRHDADDGRLVIVNELFEPYGGPIQPEWIETLRFTNRAANRRFTTVWNPKAWKEEARERERKRWEPTMRDGVHMIEEGDKMTYRAATPKSFIPKQIG